jgi:sec-independent protein translocase protein TatA
MLGNLNGWHLVIILAIVLLLFGAPKLPALARSVGQSMRIFRGEVKTLKEESAGPDADDDAARDSAERPADRIEEPHGKS